MLVLLQHIAANLQLYKPYIPAHLRPQPGTNGNQKRKGNTMAIQIRSLRRSTFYMFYEGSPPTTVNDHQWPPIMGFRGLLNVCACPQPRDSPPTTAPPPPPPLGSGPAEDDDKRYPCSTVVFLLRIGVSQMPPFPSLPTTQYWLIPPSPPTGLVRRLPPGR